MKVILMNGTELEAIQVNGQTRYFQGANRDALEFQFAKESTTFDSLDTLFGTPDNTRKITAEYDALDNDGNLVRASQLYENYSLRVGLGIAPVVIASETGTEPEISEERFTVTMAQKTYAEKQLEELQAAVAALTSAS